MRKIERLLEAAWRVLTSLKTTVFCLAALMILVAACTLAQVHLGTYGAVKAYIRCFFVYWPSEDPALKIPIFPGGGLVGAVLLVNLVGAQLLRLERSWRKAGIWAIHLGLVILFAGEFVTGFFQQETRMILEEGGQKRWFSESDTEVELALVEEGEGDSDRVYALSHELLGRACGPCRGRAVVEDGRLPFRVLVHGYDPGDSAAPPEDRIPRVSAAVEILREGRSSGRLELSSHDESSRVVVLDGRSLRVSLRPRRRYFPFSLALKDFTHEKYPGTEIPRNFSSLVALSYPAGQEEREVFISMNNPLRYQGLSFYQASFGQGDTVSILQVVENPGRLMPYVSCALVSLGLLGHFLLRLKNATRGS